MSAVPPSTQIERMEEELLGLIRAALDATFRIEPFPEDPDTWDDAQTGRAALLQYRGSDYRDADGNGAATQRRDTGFVIHLVYNATAKTGSRPVKDIERLRLALQGVDVMGGDVRIVRDGLAEQGRGRRRYIVELRVEVPVIARDRPALTPLMTDFHDRRA